MLAEEDCMATNDIDHEQDRADCNDLMRAQAGWLVPVRENVEDDIWDDT
jgi:hypothetical protein